jgi:secondary thiamine-phosphate synthase enzyme
MSPLAVVPVRTSDISLRTNGEGDLHDVTEEVEHAVREAGVAAGLVLISIPHTTCAVLVNEDEPGFREDFRRALERLAPRDTEYAHDRAPHDGEDEQPNGGAHIRAAFLSSVSVTLPIREGNLALGKWQRIFLAELDRPRQRTVRVDVYGVQHSA